MKLQKTKQITIVALSVILITSCTKMEIVEQTIREENTQSILFINLSGEAKSKAIGSDHGNQTNDNHINTLDIFVFNADGAAAGVLDAYKQFTSVDGVTNLEIKATTGKKTIYAVANSHSADWAGVVNLTEFNKIQSSLISDDVKNFIMTGSVDATLQVTTSITFAISRLAAKIELTGIKTSFAGTPYQGMKLSNVKAYLTNVHSVKHLFDGNMATPVLLNKRALVATDANSCAMSGMLYDAITPIIDDAGYRVPHFFYTYENILETETADNRFTRLVIQADINGTTYYYPVNINQQGYGYVASNGHKGVKRNTAYQIGVTIMRPGSTDPDKPVEHGVLSATLNILNWNITSSANPEF